VGYNSDGFDWNYLVNRGAILGIKPKEIYPTMVRRKNPATHMMESVWTYMINGKYTLDLHSFMSNPSIKNYAFGGKYDNTRLEDVATGILGYGKYEHDLWFSDMSSAELAFYNLKDTELLIDLLDHNNEIIYQLMIMLMRLGNITFKDISRKMISATLKGYVDSILKVFNYLPPNRVQLESVGQIQSISATGKSFKGALVIDPTDPKYNSRGVHFDVIAVDYQSLYPSEIKNRNISFETINCGHKSCKKNTVPELDHYICDQKVGFLSIILGFIRDARVYYFKPEKKNNPEFGVIEQALKVLINAGYGVFSSKMFEYYCPPLGEIVTAYGRNDITAVFDKVENDGSKVLYADTDSAFLESDMDYVQGLINWVREHIGLELGIDYIAQFMVLYRSKNYLMNIDGKFNIKGMTGKKKHTPPIIKEIFQNVLEITKEMNKETYPLIKKRILEAMQKYYYYIKDTHEDEIDPAMFKVSQTISKAPNDYDKPTIAARAGMAMANHINAKLDRKVAIQKIVPAGSIIEYIYVDKGFNVTKTGKPVRPLPLTEGYMIDRNAYINNMISVLSQITECFGISEDEIKGQNTLEGFF
jgi:DNA polymerase I